ncbi:MAG: nicotinate-nucleotide diphosphorylase (carboxylating) [Chloroflexota bacterium]|nr:MAG: nicotinate-nucleotide diphosphorylase (carboxylating) [Chloroflexota bacterium]
MKHYPHIEQAIHTALAEDISSGDVTTLAIVAEDGVMHGRFIAKAPGIIAGLEVARRAFTLLDERVILTPQVQDGDLVTPGQLIATIHGPARALLSGERTALNFLQRMSGIATLTRQFVDAVAGTKAVILDTRKTAPGLRAADKLAVQMGGGQNHRFGLFDMALIKDNHIAAAHGDLAEAVRRVKKYAPDTLIEIEVTTLAQLRTAVTLPVDRIMLDNMSLDEMRQAVNFTAGRIPLEASGNVNLDTIRAIAETGVDYISIGALTHSVKALDISLELA